MSDQCVALVGELLQQAADADLVIAVSALKRGNLVVNQRFELAGARQRALNAVAHSRHLAAHRRCRRVERILFGSDWPHGEGVSSPLDFTKELGGFNDSDAQKIMHDNCEAFLGSPA